MRIERGAIYKIGERTYGVIEVDVDQTWVKLVELKPENPADRITVSMTGPALLNLLSKQEVEEINHGI